MIDLETCKDMANKVWMIEYSNIVTVTPPDTKIKTGDVGVDTFLKYLEVVYGFEFFFADKYIVDNFKVIDEKKFMYFLLKWS